jgi:hypothetical protein
MSAITQGVACIIRTHSRTASTKIPAYFTVLPLEFVAEIISIVNTIVQTVVLKLFMKRKTGGFKAWRARRIISTIVKMRHSEHSIIQIGTVLKN